MGPFLKEPTKPLNGKLIIWAPSALEEARIHPCLKRKSAMSLEHPCTFFWGICQDYNALIAFTQAISLGSICSNQPWGMRSCLPPGLGEGCCKTTGSLSWMLLSCDANLLYLSSLQLHLHETWRQRELTYIMLLAVLRVKSFCLWSKSLMTSNSIHNIVTS